MELATEADWINFLLEESQKESYEEQLERQKTLLLAQKEAEDWKRLVFETDRFREQYLREDRLDLKQVFKQRSLLYKLNQPRLKTVIDQGLERWMKDDGGAEDDYQKETTRLRSRLDRMKKQAARLKDTYEKVKESKSHKIVQESTRKVREQEDMIAECQKAIDDLCKQSNEQGRKEWNETKQMIVELSKLYTGINMMVLEKEAVLQNNEIRRVKIIQLGEEIEQAKIEQEKEAKRREIELSERILIPIKITPMTLENSMFKNPNDFPALIDKIESTRKSYEQIFKRPEYMDLRKLKKKNKKQGSKNSAHFDLLFGGSKRKGKNRKSQSKSATSDTVKKPLKGHTVEKTVTTDEGVTHAKKCHVKVVRDELPSTPPVTKPSAPVEGSATKRSSQSDKDLSKPQPSPVTKEKISAKEPPVVNKRKSSVENIEDQRKPIGNTTIKRKASVESTVDQKKASCNEFIEGQHKPTSNATNKQKPSVESSQDQFKSPSNATNKRKASVEFTEDQHKPICNVQGQRIKQRSAQSMSQPDLPAVTRESATKSEPPKKRRSLETPISASAPVQDSREFKKPQPMQEKSPEKQIRKPKPKKVAFKSQPEPFEPERDDFSFSPERSNRKTKPRSSQQPVEQPPNRSPSPPPQQKKQQQPPEDLMDFDPQEHQPQTTIEDDNFSFGSASPPLDSRRSKDDGGSFFDTGSISSFEMEDRESGSDLGFDLSPVGPSAGKRRDALREEGGSDGNTSDFDFLASPPKSAAPPGSQGAGRKGQDSFAFTDDDDSGTGFDFF